MGQKVNPHGIRVGVIKNWNSRWYTNDQKFGDTLVSDYKVRKYLKSELYKAGVASIEIERDTKRVRVFINCAKPGLVIGRGGELIDKYKATLEKMVGMPVTLNVVEIKQPDLNAQLVAENIAAQLENRIAFRRAMKMAIRNTMRLGAKGIKITCGGRLGGAEIAKVEHYHEGTIPLQTLRADIEYGVAEAATTYGRIGVKVWIYQGEVLNTVNRTGAVRDNRDNRGDRRDRRDGGFNRGGDRRFGNNNGYGNGNRNFGGNRAPRRDAAPTSNEGGNK